MIEVNGVTLPDIPADVLESYSYLSIVSFAAFDGQILYQLMGFSEPFVYIPKEINPSQAVDALYVAAADKPWATYLCATGYLDAWEADGSGESHGADAISLINDPATQVTSLIWSNHDILTATAQNDDGTYEVGTEVYFPSSVVLSGSKYFMPAYWYKSMANHSRRLYNSKDKMKPRDVLASLQEIQYAEGVEF